MSLARLMVLHSDLRRRLVLSGSIGLVAAALLLGYGSARPAEARSPVEPPAGQLTVVELFTSQGCSSCPPANANLVALAGRPNILALSWNVTYWDDLGWKDTFAQAAFTQRQRDYQHGLGTDNVWTPQVVVDGRQHTVGQRLRQIQDLVDHRQAFTGPTVVFRDGAVGLAGGMSPSRPADVWLVRYEPRPIEVPIARGENGGRTLPHADVVRELVRLGDWRGATVGYALPAASRADLRTAVLVQAPGGGPILAAGKTG